MPGVDKLVLHLAYDAESDVLVYYEAKSESIIITFLTDGKVYMVTIVNRVRTLVTMVTT